MSVGGSHTNFDAAAFGPGAVGGALTLGGALAAGVANFRAAQQARYEDWTVEQLVAAVRYSELMRAQDQITLGRENQRLRKEIARLRRNTVVSAARRLSR